MVESVPTVADDTVGDTEADTPATISLPRRGSAVVNGHCGELVQGVYHDASGKLHRALTTLPADSFSSTVTFELRQQGADEPRGGAATQGVVTVEPPSRTKALKAATTLLQRFGLRHLDGHIVLRGHRVTYRDRVKAQGLGTDNNASDRYGEGIQADYDSERDQYADILSLGGGTSTMDVVATLHAVLDAAGHTLSAEEVGRITVEVETASDPLMFPQEKPIIWAHREGVVLERLPGPMPALDCLAVIADTAPVDTLAFPPARYNAEEIDTFAELWAALRKGTREGCCQTIGAAASGSAEINQRHLPKRGWDALCRLGDDYGAVGLSVAHSGQFVTFLFDAADPNACHRQEALIGELFHVMCPLDRAAPRDLDAFHNRLFAFRVGNAAQRMRIAG